MEQASKKRKLDSYHGPNTPRQSTVPTEHCESSSSHSQHINIHAGEGFLNSNGNLTIKGSYNAQHNYYNVSLHPDTPSQSSNGRDTTISEEENIASLIASLKFTQIDTRRTSIKRAYATTCLWFLKTPQYLEWLDPNKFDRHGGLLWVKGKPGAGKSTLMNFTFSHVRPKLRKYGAIVISFFFNARGDDLEKSTAGLYRSLLVQLFESHLGVQDILDNDNWPASDWTLESLQNLFETVILSIGEASIVCFIDALDECDEQEVRDMLSFLQNMSDQAVSSGTRLHICLASRHYPHITVSRGLSLTIESQVEHDKDITKYLAAELRIGSGSLANQIRSDLQAKSSGVFMWVVLVVGILNKEFDRGRVLRLPEILCQIPSDLHTLFRDILTRDNGNNRGLLLCIQWVLFAKRPLSPEELYFAIMSGIEPHELSLCHQGEETNIDTDAIQKYILDNSKGLAESTKSAAPTVQFIHESVRDFLLKEKGLQDIWPNIGANLVDQSHEELKNCCIAYLVRDDAILNYDLPDPLLSPAAATLREKVAGRFKFLEYAIHNILYHAEKAERNGAHQSEILSSISLYSWIKYSNLFEKFQARRYTWEQSCFHVVGNERYGPPIFAARATQSDEAVQALLELEAMAEPPESATHALCRRHAATKDRSNRFGRDFTYSQKKGLLYHLVYQEDEIILLFALAQGKHMLVESLLGVAVKRENRAIAQILLDSGARVNTSSTVGPLAIAAELGYEYFVTLLLDKGASVDGLPYHSANPLCLAAKNGHGAIVQVLLDRGANIDGAKNIKQRPIYLAKLNGHPAIVKLLASRGATLDEVAMINAAADSGHTAIVQRLL
ncbi:hypothetical protein Hte_002126 [Hypoxylon texense]